MQIRSVILHNVCNFKTFERSFEDNWSETTPDGLLLIGPNGCGKTTLLNVIAGLWQKLFDFFTHKLESAERFDTLLATAEFAAMEIVDLDRDPIWICIDHETASAEVREFFAAHPESHRVRVVYAPGQQAAYAQRYEYAHPGTAQLQAVTDDTGLAWVERWSDQLTRNLLGTRYDLPNLVYLESESRLLLPLKERFVVQPEPEDYRWLAIYTPTTTRKGSLQNYLYNLKIVDEQAYAEVTHQVNDFLGGKSLYQFDRRTGDLLVRIEGGGEHPIEELSSGEKQVLLMLVAITRWLRPGGILLIDEPDLHLHVSLTTSLVDYLHRMVTARGGQLILASHEPELWRLFTDPSLIRLGYLDERGRAQ